MIFVLLYLLLAIVFFALYIAASISHKDKVTGATLTVFTLTALFPVLNVCMAIGAIATILGNADWINRFMEKEFF